MIKPTLQKPITIDSLQKYSIELEALVHSLEYERSWLRKAYNELADELDKAKEENEVLKSEIKGDTSLPFKLKLDEEKLRHFIDASLFTCMDLNYNLFHKKSCHDECCDCPLDSVESMIEWLGKEGSSNCEACKQNCVEDLIKCIKDQK